MTGESPVQVSFQAHAELLQTFLDHRKKVVERIEGVLNAQRKPTRYLQDRPKLFRMIEDGFFTLPAVTADQSRLRGELQDAHRGSGFRPRQVPGLHNDLVDPAEMAVRGFHCWQQTRWPGRNGRLRYAQTLFDVYVLRCLEFLSMRIWDGGSCGPSERLAQIQDLLDALWAGAPADQPVLVRDARWLIPLAQSPTTDELAAYFDVAQKVAKTLTDEDRLEIQKAHVVMIGGHLRSQIRHYCMQEGVPFDDDSVVLRTRTSNALDFALLIQGLVPMLEAYESAQQSGDTEKRLELAGAICQGISPDPELFLDRVDLLAPYSMMEQLFVAADRGAATDRKAQAAYTPMGKRHLRLFREYAALIARLSKPLHGDCPGLRPVEGAFSPYGAIYGTPTNLTEDMALKTLQPGAVTRFALEDVFADSRGGADRLAWVRGWRQLPHVDPKIRRLYDYPQRFAENLFERIEQALRLAAADGAANDVSETGRICILVQDEPDPAAPIPDLPVRYLGSSDTEIVAAGKAGSYDETRLLRDRQEGYFAVSFEISGGWVAIRKDFLSEILAAGHDVKIGALPPAAAEVLRLMCPGLVRAIRR